MSVIIIDTSALIDLAKAGIIEEALSLTHEFLIPDVIFEDELISLEGYGKETLLKSGNIPCPLAQSSDPMPS